MVDGCEASTRDDEQVGRHALAAGFESIHQLVRFKKLASRLSVSARVHCERDYKMVTPSERRTRKRQCCVDGGERRFRDRSRLVVTS